MASSILTIKTTSGHCFVKSFDFDNRAVWTECGKIIAVAAVIETNATVTCKRCAASCRVTPTA